jgi:TPR repeat protein
VPAKFWEESIIKMLGEGEGTFLLGLLGTELMNYDPFRSKTKTYAPPIEAYMLRSALAGNRDGMFGAYLTGENRDSEHFTPPKNEPEVPVLPEKFLPETSFEGRYWMSHSAHAGNRWGMRTLAEYYMGKPPVITPDVEKAEYYWNMAVLNGSKAAADNLGLLYAKGDILPQDCAKSVYYGAIATRLKEGGQIVLDNKETFPYGYNLRIVKEGLMEGNLTFAGKRAIDKPCLTEAQFNDAVERSKPAYEVAKAAKDKDQAAHNALYEAARKKLPEIKAAYEAAMRAQQEKKYCQKL